MVFDDVTADMRLAWEEPFGMAANSVEFFPLCFENVENKEDSAGGHCVRGGVDRCVRRMFILLNSFPSLNFCVCLCVCGCYYYTGFL